ncbi:MAG: bactofilin family protein [Syntrophothermus sp.]|nr:polymer-forming cytoskeletal protein [Ignavibacteriaceae bacterium]
MKIENRDEVTNISQGVLIDGKVTSSGSIRIDGKVNGDVLATGTIIVGESGEITGEVSADIINMGGKVQGTLRAKDKITLENKSNLKGDLITKVLVVEAGAIFDGKSTMSGGANVGTTGTTKSEYKATTTPANEPK